MRLTRRALISSAITALAALLAPSGRADDVTTTAGKKLAGKLVAVDAQGVTLTTADVKVTVPARDIVLVDLSAGKKKFELPGGTAVSEVVLTDGSSIRVAKYSLRGKQFATEPLPGPAGLAAPVYDLPMGAVFSVSKKATDPKHRAAWEKMLSYRGKRDLYVIEQEAGLTFVQGTILDGLEKDGAWRLSFEKEDGAKDTLLQSRAVGLVLYQPQPASVAPTLCRVHDVYGNALNATAIALAPDGVTVTTVSGATVKYPSAESLARLDYALGNVAYLSDLAPQVVAPELPAEEKKLNPAAPYLRDRSLSNEKIKLDNATFEKGLCVAPDTVLTYNLVGGDYAQFKATVGIDENGANATSAAKVTIEADGQVLFSKLVRRTDKGEGVVLAVKGVKQLKLIVEADTPFNGNYVTLAEARVQK
jgi:hypothetical protein